MCNQKQYRASTIYAMIYKSLDIQLQAKPSTTWNIKSQWERISRAITRETIQYNTLYKRDNNLPWNYTVASGIYLALRLSGETFYHLYIRTKDTLHSHVEVTHDNLGRLYCKR